MSPKLWVVISAASSGSWRCGWWWGQLLALVQRYPPLVDGAFVIIAWVGFKLCWEYMNQAGVVHLEIPQWLSLSLIREHLHRGVHLREAARAGGRDAAR
jgi:predicted tellurium resistance membrane protein TerC